MYCVELHNYNTVHDVTYPSLGIISSLDCYISNLAGTVSHVIHQLKQFFRDTITVVGGVGDIVPVLYTLHARTV